MRLAGKIAIVVGAGQTPGEGLGNGRAAALLFAREGARLLLVDRDGASLAETVRQVEAAGGEAARFEADVTETGHADAFVADAIARYGRIDILHNNVGVAAGDGPVTEVPEAVWRRIVDVNLTGTFLSCRAVLPAMRDQQSGVILNVSSAAAVCSLNLVAYKASKAGLHALSQMLAIENAPHGIRVNVVMPGLIDTPVAVSAPAAASGVPAEQLRATRDARVPLKGGMGSAWDVAHAALFLASDDARFITGAVLPVDGGQTARIG